MQKFPKLKQKSSISGIDKSKRSYIIIIHNYTWFITKFEFETLFLFPFPERMLILETLGYDGINKVTEIQQLLSENSSFPKWKMK